MTNVLSGGSGFDSRKRGGGSSFHLRFYRLKSLTRKTESIVKLFPYRHLFPMVAVQSLCSFLSNPQTDLRGEDFWNFEIDMNLEIMRSGIGVWPEWIRFGSQTGKPRLEVLRSVLSSSTFLGAPCEGKWEMFSSGCWKSKCYGIRWLPAESRITFSWIPIWSKVKDVQIPEVGSPNAMKSEGFLEPLKG